MGHAEHLRTLNIEVTRDVFENILPFWIEKSVDLTNGGFFGVVDNDGTIHGVSPKSVVLNTRILWTFSAAYRMRRDDVYLELARRAFQYIRHYFWDARHEGLFWMLDHTGKPVDDSKKVYGQAFAIYALADYYRATGDDNALRMANSLYDLIEANARDAALVGYFDFFRRDWTLLDNASLDATTDMNAARTMNTHLHVLESYTNFLRVRQDETLRSRLRELIHVFIGKIIDPQRKQFNLFFDKNWRPVSEQISFGHDIEGSWLLCEAVEVLGDDNLQRQVGEIAVQMVDATLSGLDEDGSLFYEGDPGGITCREKHWWPQAEALVGFLNAYQMTGEEKYLQACFNCWNFIKDRMIDRDNGEWFAKIDAHGKIIESETKVSAWKAPYHNSRACFEVKTRTEKILKAVK
jgi:mannobiose 2-epimerase